MAKDMDRVRGALYGVAVGDALGAPLEFMSAEEIKAQHGCVREMIGGGWLHLKPGELTDDTQMTLCVARGIVERPEDPIDAIARNFMEWFDAGPADVGNLCRAVLSAAKRYGWDRVREMSLSAFGDRVEGNGALMRTIYTPLYYGTEHARWTRAIAQITHPGPISTNLCVEYCDLIARYIRGGDRPGKEPLRFERGSQPTGFVLHSFNVALECFADTDSFEEGLITAVNRGGDADTIGAIYGGLAGAYYGFHQIPSRWVDSLDPDTRRELDLYAGSVPRD